MPSARATGQEKQVGPLFGAGAGEPHGCSASVVHSPGHDLLITAAHCIDGTGVGDVFAPDYRNGASPYLTWRVDRAWVSPQWAAHGNPDLDVALLQVAARVVRHRTEQVEDVVGAEVLGHTPAPGTTVSVVGYTRGMDDRQITCRNALTRLDEFPAFSCHGYVGGTSGSPFLVGSDPRVVVGVVGGRDDGGCSEAVSYSPPFGAAITTLYDRAVADDPGDTVPAQRSDC